MSRRWADDTGDSPRGGKREDETRRRRSFFVAPLSILAKSGISGLGPSQCPDLVGAELEFLGRRGAPQKLRLSDSWFAASCCGTTSM